MVLFWFMFIISHAFNQYYQFDKLNIKYCEILEFQLNPLYIILPCLLSRHYNKLLCCSTNLLTIFYHLLFYATNVPTK